MLNVKPVKREVDEKKVRQKSHKHHEGLCLISGIIRDSIPKPFGSGFLVGNLELVTGIPPQNCLVTSEKVIGKDDFKKYVLKFRKSNSKKSGNEMKEIPLHEIASTSKPFKPPDDTSGIVFITLSEKREDFLKGRYFTVVDEIHNYEDLYCCFVNTNSEMDLVELEIVRNGQGDFQFREGADRNYTTYDALMSKNTERKPHGGAILQYFQSEYKCVGALKITDYGRQTLSPVFFPSLLRPRDWIQMPTGGHQQKEKVSLLCA